MTPDDIRARAYGCALLAGIFKDGLTDEWLSWAQDIPGVGAHVPMPFDPRQAAATHHDLFGMNVFPHGGVFLDPDALLGGSTAEGAAEFSQALGLPITSAGASDHLSTLLSLLEFLCDAEADAAEDDLPAEAARMRGWQLRLLDEHMLTWLPAFAVAVERQGDPFYGALAGFTLDFLGQIRDELGAAILSMPPAFTLPDAPELLADPKTSLKDLAAFLLKPALCGLFLSRADISRIARKFELPHGFGERLIMLHNLFKSAADYDSFPALMTELIDVARATAAAHQQQAEQPGLARTALIWAARAKQTNILLRAFRDQSAEGTTPA